ncbi:MAG: hypothetical protein AB1422_05345 [bacterium]
MGSIIIRLDHTLEQWIKKLGLLVNFADSRIDVRRVEQEKV